MLGGDIKVILWIHFCCSVAQSCLTLCDAMDCSTPGLPVHHQLPEFTQTLVQPSHPLSPPSPPAFTLSLLKFTIKPSPDHF